MIKSVPVCIIILVVALVTSTISAEDHFSKQIRLGFFEGGESVTHDELREEFMAQLQLLLPDSVEAVAVPQGYGSGGWKRDTCRLVAEGLTQATGIDLMITMGPWVVEDLLEAGYQGPILAMHRVDPVLEGLLDSLGRPIAENLTIHFKPGKLEADLQTLAGMASIRKLGLLCFPSGDELYDVAARVARIGLPLGFQVVLGEAYDNNGTFAFFKAYAEMESGFDALYVMPFWGMTTTKASDFLMRATEAHFPVMVWEGMALVNRGATISNSGVSLVAEARFNASKAVRIVEGETPADLPVAFTPPGQLVINEASAARTRFPVRPATHGDAVIVSPAPIVPGEFFNLRAAVRRSLDQNPDHLARLDALVAADQAAKQVKATYLPHIEATYDLTQRDDDTIYNWRGLLDQTGHRAGLKLTQTIFSLESLRAIETSRRRSDLAETDRKRTELDLESAVTAAYLDYLRSSGVLTIEQKYRLRIDRGVEQAQASHLLDSIGLSDLYRWYQERDEASNRISRAKRDRAEAQARLNSLLNIPWDRAPGLDTSDFTEEQFLTDYLGLLPLLDSPHRRKTATEWLISAAREGSPELSERRLRTTIQESLLSQNAARFYPSVGVRAALEYRDELTDQPPDFREEHRSWSLGAALKWTLFSGGERIHERSRLKADLSRLEYERDGEALRVTRDVTIALEELASVATNSFRTVRSQGITEKIADMAVESYIPGKPALFLEVIDGLERHRRAQVTGLNGRYDFYKQISRLLSTTGRSLLDQRLSLAGSLMQMVGL